MNTSRSKYHVHAEVVVTGASIAGLDAAKAGHPIERRLNRMERVAASCHGQLEQRFSNGLKITFETADAALLGACEMQQRCLVLPQVSGHRLALRIGIHWGVARQRSRDGDNETRGIAAQLAVIDDGIAASGDVVAALKPELRKLAHPESDLSGGIAVHKIDWRCEIPSTAYGGESLWPGSMVAQPGTPYLLLHYGLKTLELTQIHPAATIGREPLNDLTLMDDHVSRNHCRIERRSDCIVLIDSSTNGTCVTPDQGEELVIKRGSVALKGKGMLFFGRSCNGERRGGARYEAYL